MVDRAARDQLIGAMDAYMSDAITAFDFDERIFAVATKDATVGHVVSSLWFYYDDCRDHRVHGPKLVWDLYERLRLLLASDAELIVETQLVWMPVRQAGATAALTLGVVLAVHIGWDVQLLAVLLGTGLAARALLWARDRASPKMALGETRLVPFASRNELSAVRRSVPAFSKRRYRPEIGDRHVRGRAAESLLRVSSIVPFAIFSPFILLWLAWPDRRARERVALQSARVGGAEHLTG